MEVGDGLAVLVVHAHELDGAVPLQDQVVADVVGPVGEAETGVEDVLAPAPLVKAGGHRDSRAGVVAVVLVAHVVVLEGFQGGVQFVQGGGYGQAQIVQPCLVDHRELGDGVDGVVLLLADAGGAHLLGGGQAVDAAVAHGDGGLDVGVGLQDGGQVGHDVGGDVGLEVDEGAVRAVVGQVVVGEAHAHEGVGQVAARDADVHLLGQGVAHGVPLDVDAGGLLHLVQHLVVGVAGGQGPLAADDGKVGLLGALHHAVLIGDGGVGLGPAAGSQGQGRAGQCGRFEEVAAGNQLFHMDTPFLTGFVLCAAQPLTAPAMKPFSKYFWTKG